MESVLIAGYRHTDLGIFSDKDPRISIIKKAIRRDCIRLIEEGVKWFVFTGNLGFEYWALEVLEELKTEAYEFQTATIFPFANHGEQWNEANQAKLALFKSTDFVKYAYPNLSKNFFQSTAKSFWNFFQKKLSCIVSISELTLHSLIQAILEVGTFLFPKTPCQWK